MHSSAPLRSVRRPGEVGRRAATIVIATVLGSIALSGCASIDKSVASDLQQSVQQVASLSASSDTASALAELDALQVKVDEAKSSGEVSDDRATTIQEGIDLVRADLDAIVAQQAAEQAAAEAAAQAAQKAADEAAAATAAAEKAAADEAARLAKEAADAAEDADDDKPGNSEKSEKGKKDD